MAGSLRRGWGVFLSKTPAAVRRAFGDRDVEAAESVDPGESGGRCTGIASVCVAVLVRCDLANVTPTLSQPDGTAAGPVRADSASPRERHTVGYRQQAK